MEKRALEQKRMKENVSGARQLRALKEAQKVKGIKRGSSGLLACWLQVQEPGSDSACSGRGLRLVLLGCRSLRTGIRVSFVRKPISSLPWEAFGQQGGKV